MSRIRNTAEKHTKCGKILKMPNFKAGLEKTRFKKKPAQWFFGVFWFFGYFLYNCPKERVFRGFSLLGASRL
jgi:hypothetical protein